MSSRASYRIIRGERVSGGCDLTCHTPGLQWFRRPALQAVPSATDNPVEAPPQRRGSRDERRKGTAMAQRQQGTPTQLDLTYDGSWPVAVRPVAKPRRGATRLCAVCGRVPAHLTLEREPRHRPARLCLRCHHAVMRQRRMARAGLEPVERGATHGGGLIVPRKSGLSADALSRRLSRSRRRAQKAARVALGAG